MCDWLNLGFLTQVINQNNLDADWFWTSSATTIKGHLACNRMNYIGSGWKCPNEEMIKDPAKDAKFGDPNYMKPLTFESPIQTCSWASELDAMMNSAMNNVQGFELSEFSSRKDLWKGFY